MKEFFLVTSEAEAATASSLAHFIRLHEALDCIHGPKHYKGVLYIILLRVFIESGEVCLCFPHNFLFFGLHLAFQLVLITGGEQVLSLQQDHFFDHRLNFEQDLVTSKTSLCKMNANDLTWVKTLSFVLLQGYSFADVNS